MTGKAPYASPFTLSAEVLRLVAEIAEAVGRAMVVVEGADGLRLRRVNRVRTIHGTLAIEGNRLTEAQITAIMEGKRVLAPPREVQEVRNVLRAYEGLAHWDPASEGHLLEAHRHMMTGLLERPGAYRSGGVGVMAGEVVIHRAPPASQVQRCMAELLDWLGRSGDHPLIASSVFHYELEFIHPFADGNGRMGRLWQTLILSRWRRMLLDLPIENLVHAHQDAYYRAIQESTAQTSATPFVELMLGLIRQALAELSPEDATEQVAVQATEQVLRLLVIVGEGACPARTLMERLGLAHRPGFLYDYLHPAIAGGWLTMTDPDRPRSPRQGYRLTAQGRALVALGLAGRRTR